jgi:hypothetical protein
MKEALINAHYPILTIHGFFSILMKEGGEARGASDL